MCVARLALKDIKEAAPNILESFSKRVWRCRRCWLGETSMWVSLRLCRVLRVKPVRLGNLLVRSTRNRVSKLIRILLVLSALLLGRYRLVHIRVPIRLSGVGILVPVIAIALRMLWLTLTGLRNILTHHLILISDFPMQQADIHSGRCFKKPDKSEDLMAKPYSRKKALEQQYSVCLSAMSRVCMRGYFLPYLKSRLYSR